MRHAHARSIPDVTPADVLAFWFGAPPADTQDVMEKIRRWFQGGEAFDREIVERFSDTVQAAVTGDLDSWSATPRGRLALVLLLDQLTRSVFRGTPRMFAGDARAQTLALDAFAPGSVDDLSFVERLFLSLPLLHAESLALQDREAEIARALARQAPPRYELMSTMHLEQSAKYRGVIARFGRFPHRNAVLGRASTAEEIEFLVDWAAKAPPADMRAHRTRARC